MERERNLIGGKYTLRVMNNTSYQRNYSLFLEYVLMWYSRPIIFKINENYSLKKINIQYKVERESNMISGKYAPRAMNMLKE